LLHDALGSTCYVAVSCRELQGVAVQCVVGSCRVLQCIAVCCRVLPCVAVCRSVLQCVAGRGHFVSYFCGFRCGMMQPNPLTEKKRCNTLQHSRSSTWNASLSNFCGFGCGMVHWVPRAASAMLQCVAAFCRALPFVAVCCYFVRCFVWDLLLHEVYVRI